MCGIVGVAGPQEDDWIAAMSGMIAHRGPDDSGVFRDRDAKVSLAMRRLAIIDLVGGHQPMSTPDGRYTIVFNGEIFNAIEIRRELESAGVTFSTGNSDTEVLLKLLAREGKDALRRLNGMFAFALWDGYRRELFCARDRFGIKPFYYISQQGRFAFASEMKSLLSLPWIDRAINRQSLYHYMSLMFVPGTETALEGVCRLSAGSWLTLGKDGGIESGRWWTPKVGHLPAVPRAEALQEIRTALESAVTSWSVSDVAVGCSLSGGLDSSAIVGLLAKQGQQVHTYSVGFSGQDEGAWNELPLARRVAQKWGTVHEEIILDPESLLDDLVEMVWHLDEPYGGGLPSWAVFKAMSRSVKVGMTGTGGDELFGNYGKWRELEGGWIRRVLFGERAAPEHFRKHFFERYYYLPDQAKREWVFQEYPPGADTADLLYRTIFGKDKRISMRDRCAMVDLETQLPEEFLMMTDRFSMAHSIEARTPFLDHRLAEYVLGLPAGLRTRRKDLKGLLRDAVADVLPPELLKAPKRGFVIPLTLWLRGTLRPLVERLLDAKRLAAQGLFRPEFHERYVRPHVEGRVDFTQVVWAALMFQLWHMVFIEGSGEKPRFNIRDLA
ncbi:MAG: asparagine synthase (glutamine-hydrolyzing) [Rhodocyclaceae bacterium]